ncbi:gamma-glutamyltranspeptidase 1-like [Acanthaster planci]|uniref:Gamma-glutamyltranspeptidase 1-like n=1 Tax=Acanthaster planci TaxID=133434 RepID=A0A8B7Y248_ACAPL|nr:gamma-glutamyltranspeptidase 1-like [Acanthaster planci]
MENGKSTLELTGLDVEKSNVKGKSKVLRWQVAFALLLIVAVGVSVTMGLLYYYKDDNAVTVTPLQSQPPPQPTGEYQYAKAAVAADAGECSEIGREIFLNSEGEILKEGDTLVDIKLAETYKKLAEGGENAFYKGDLADDIVADIADRGGIITKADLENYQVRRKEPLMFELDGMKVYSPPPPGSGAVYALIMNILQGYGIGPDSIATTEAEILTTHRMVEAFKFAYAGRSFLGDEDYVDVKEVVANMTSQSYADSLRAAIDDNMSHDPSYYTAYYNQPDGGTSHLSVVDTYGNAVAATSTINLYFGSKVRGNRTGILFNDLMDDFSKPGEPNAFGVPPSVSNFIRPGKRPMSSMTPTIVLDHEGKVKLVVGASGGTRITTGVAQVSVDALWYGDSIKDAIQRRRFHHQLVPNNVTYEAGFNQDVIDGLRAKGHYPYESTRGCVVQGIMRDAHGFWRAYSDDRKGGYPAGI